MFEPWQGPVFTTIRHRQKLGYYAHLPRHIFAPCQAESILATYSRGRVFTIPLDWFACPTTSYSYHTSVRRSEDFRFGNFISVIQITTYISLSFRLFWFPRPSFILKPYVGIEPTSSAWKADILAVIRIGQIWNALAFGISILFSWPVKTFNSREYFVLRNGIHHSLYILYQKFL